MKHLMLLGNKNAVSLDFLLVSCSIVTEHLREYSPLMWTSSLCWCSVQSSQNISDIKKISEPFQSARTRASLKFPRFSATRRRQQWDEKSDAHGMSALLSAIPQCKASHFIEAEIYSKRTPHLLMVVQNNVYS